MTHTKEPWSLASEGASTIRNEDWDFIASTCKPSWNYICDEALANANRIILCVNACAGITNEALEKGIVRDSIIKRMKEAYPFWDYIIPAECELDGVRVLYDEYHPDANEGRKG